MKEDKLISKSEYAHAQLGNFISVKQYMIYRYRERKCLLVRFANESQYKFDSFEFTLIQLDSKGGIIKESKSSCEKLDFNAGSRYAMDKGIVIEDRCVDCRIYITSAISGKYLYRVSDGRRLTVHYLTEDDWHYDPSACSKAFKKANGEGFVAQRKKAHPYGMLKLIASLAAISLILTNAFSFYDNLSPEKPETQAEEAAENEKTQETESVEEKVAGLAFADIAEA